MMAHSVFEMFRIGIGPSSSHTVGPMRAARAFLTDIAEADVLASVAAIKVELFGSLALTGLGHGTDSAVIAGLAGHDPGSVDPDELAATVRAVREDRYIELHDTGTRIRFDPGADIRLIPETSPGGHPNALTFVALDNAGAPISVRTFFSVGGGFITETPNRDATPPDDVPLPFTTAAELLAVAERSGLAIPDVVHANECARRTPEQITAGLNRILDAMTACMDRGLAVSGELPGGLRVRRRAAELYATLRTGTGRNPHEVMDWISVYAIAVNEENAAGGRVVTAPTNGAAGIIPAVLRYYREFCDGASRDQEHRFLLTAAAIGSLIKRNASISGAEVGCQGEVGAACAMAAAGLAAALGGTNAQIENAAEIGLEHNLGLTCDPVGGLVQVPCIERNAMAATKAVSAASLALRGDGRHTVSLDAAIRTLRETGADMSSKYKETSRGGLAVTVVEC